MVLLEETVKCALAGKSGLVEVLGFGFGLLERNSNGRLAPAHISAMLGYLDFYKSNGRRYKFS